MLGTLWPCIQGMERIMLGTVTVYNPRRGLCLEQCRTVWQVVDYVWDSVGHGVATQTMFGTVWQYSARSGLCLGQCRTV